MPDDDGGWTRALELNAGASERLTRYWAEENLADLESAVGGYRAAMLAAPGGATTLIAQLANNLGRAVESRFDQTADRSDLDEAIGCYRQALDGVPAEQRGQVRGQLASALRRRYADSDQATDLAEAITLLEDLLTTGDADAADLRELSGALGERFQLSGDRDDLDDSVDAARAAEELAAGDAEQRAAGRTCLANALLNRFEAHQRSADLAEALELLRGCDSADAAEPGRASAATMGALASALVLRWTAAGDRADLDEAVARYEAALELATPGSATSLALAGSLAAALDDRFHASGDLVDLDAEIELFGRVLAATPPGALRRPGRLHNLAVAMRTRHLRGLDRGADDLAAAVSLHREALALIPPGAAARPTVLNSLGGDLRSAFDADGDIDRLAEAVRCFEEAVVLVPARSSERPLCLNNLSAALGQYGEASDDQAALRRAAEAGAEAVSLTATESPYRAKYQLNQANALADLERREPAAGAADDVAALYREAGDRALPVSPEDAVAVAMNWSEWALARTDWEQVAEAGRIGQRAASGLVSTQVIREHQESWLRDVEGLAGRHAWALVRLGRHAEAAQVAESGRAVLLSAALREESRPLRLAAAEHPDLVDRYRRAAARVAMLVQRLDRRGAEGTEVAS